jgi:lipopolysaccharide biosynthesis regulator YciM
MDRDILSSALFVLGLVIVLWLLWIWARRNTRRRVVTPDDAYTLALSALIAGNRRLALVQLKEAVQHSSDNLDAYIRLGDLLRESGQIEKALSIHRDLTVRPRLPAGGRARILESLTRDYLAAGRFEEAGQSAERLRHTDPSNRFAFRALQEVAESLRDWPRAIKVVEDRSRLEGQKDKALLARYHGFVGGEEVEAGESKEARRRFEEALKLDPDCLLALLYLGDLEVAGGRPEKAVELWKELAERSPAHGEFVFDRLERAYFEMGQFEEVVVFYRELLHRADREDSVPALLALAEILRRKGNLDDAGSLIQEALEIEPENARAHRLLVKLAVDRKDPAEALQHLDRVLELTTSSRVLTCRHCEEPLGGPRWRCPTCRGLNPLGL